MIWWMLFLFICFLGIPSCYFYVNYVWILVAVASLQNLPLSLSFYLVWIHRDGLGEAYDRDIAFASALETFAGGHNDPISVAFGGRKDIWTPLLFSSISMGETGK